MVRRRALVLVVVMSCVLGARSVNAASSIVLPKPGQVGLEIGGGYGFLAKSGQIGNLFGAGSTFVVRGRYRMRYERAIGLTFESQSFKAREDPPTFVEGDDTTIGPRRISVITSGFEFYQMFGTRQRTTKMLMAGAGLVQARAKLNNGETQLVDVPGDPLVTGSGDGLYVSAGAGVERFFYRSWAFDLSTRYMAVFREGKPNHDVQAALGVIFYASY